MTELLTSQLEFGCACVHYDPVVCFYIRYHKNPLELTKEDVCECECHADFDPTDYNDNGDVMDSKRFLTDEDKDEFEADYDMMKEMERADHEFEMERQRADIDAIERERDEMIKRNKWEQEDGDYDA